MIGLRQEFARKAIHLTSASVPIAYAAGMPRDRLVEALFLLFALALLVEVGRRRFAPVRAGFERLTGALLRDHERVRWAGATWMLLAFTLSVLLLPRAAAIAAMWAVAVGDASAAIVGRTLGRRMRRPGAAPRSPAPPPAGKSLAGSLACLVATALGAWLVAELRVPVALAAGVAAALAERPSWRLDDNLRVAAATGVAVVALEQLRRLGAS